MPGMPRVSTQVTVASDLLGAEHVRRFQMCHEVRGAELASPVADLARQALDLLGSEPLICEGPVQFPLELHNERTKLHGLGMHPIVHDLKPCTSMPTCLRAMPAFSLPCQPAGASPLCHMAPCPQHRTGARPGDQPLDGRHTSQQ